ncbi:MAG: hypothetical protein HY080_12990 [Gammaproteobacteria bacterium]|nr:hypothetical protein [Gammaproteobacteria bacterium]
MAGVKQCKYLLKGFLIHLFNQSYDKNELQKLILAMEGEYGTSNILNSYINDNLFRFQSGIRSKKTPRDIEKAWSHGLMEGLGYQHVEAFDTGHPKGDWKEVKVHWCKRKQDLRS